MDQSAIQIPLLDVRDREPPSLPEGWSGVLVEDVSTFQRVMNILDSEREVVIDLETTGLRPQVDDRIAGVVVAVESEVYYLPFCHAGLDQPGNLPQEWLMALAMSMHRPNTTYIGHNYKFDMQFWHQCGSPWPSKVHDTMLAAHLLNQEEDRYKLEWLAHLYTDPEFALKGDEHLRDLLMYYGVGKESMWKLQAQEVAPYAFFDGYLTWRLHEFYTEPLRVWSIHGLWEELGHYSTVLAKVETRGMPLDMDRLEEYEEEAKANKDRMEAEIRAEAGNPGLNPGNPKHMAVFTGLPNTQRVTLERAEEQGNYRARMVIEYRAWEKMISSYYRTYRDRAADGVLYPNLLMHRTVTTRLASRGPNMQAVPRKGEKEHEAKKVKDLFVAREGHSFVQADYSQAEIRLGAHYTGDPNMKRILDEGRDIHAETAKETGIPRSAAKRINFAAIYGIGADTLAETLGIPVAKAAEYLDAYHERRPGYKRLYYDAQNQAERMGYIRLWTGRVRRFVGNSPPFHKASSHLIQGGVAEIIRVAMQRIDREFGDDAPMTLQVHDSVNLEIEEDRVHEILPALKEVMEDFSFDVPTLVDIGYGPDWGHQTDWKEEA